jgi:hypothetical protein
LSKFVAFHGQTHGTQPQDGIEAEAEFLHA